MGNEEFNTGGTLRWTRTPPGGVEIDLLVSCYRNRDKLHPDWPLCSYADLTFYLFISPPGEIRPCEEQTSLSQGKTQGERVNPRIDLIPYCKLFLDIVSHVFLVLGLVNCADCSLARAPFPNSGW